MATVIRRKGSPNWFARFQIDGRDYTVSTGITNKREAEAIMRRMLAEKKGAVSVADRFEGLVKELETQTRKAITQARKRELLAMRQDMARQILGAQTEKLAVRDAWQAWLDNPNKRNPGPATIRDYLSEWERFCRWIAGRDVRYLHEADKELLSRAPGQHGCCATRMVFDAPGSPRSLGPGRRCSSPRRVGSVCGDQGQPLT